MANRNKTNPFTIQEGIHKHGKLDGYSYRVSWTDNTFVSESDQGESLGRIFNIARVKALAIVVICFLSLLLGRVAWLQVINGDYYYEMAEGNRIRIKRIEAKRGVIYDRNLNPLVRNVANFKLYFVPADLPEDEIEKNKIFERISEILGDTMGVQEIKEKLSQIKDGSLESYQPLFIIDNIDYELSMLLYLETEKMPGVILSNSDRREYNLHAQSLSHILGYTGKINKKELENYGSDYLPIDYIGKMGVEYFWEGEMRGENGEKNIEVDALGKEKKIISQKEAVDGHNLVLSLDIQVQKKLEEIILKYLSEMELTKASAVVLDPSNGEIIAMVSIPAYDNNAFARGISSAEYSVLINNSDKPLFNRSVSGEYPSGSTIKPVWSAAALQEGVITENTSFISTGGIRIGQWFFPDWRAGGHGVTNVRRAISQSVNTFFYYIGGGYDDFQGLGVDRLVKYGELFGLGSQTGIDLAGESSGFLPTKEWKEEVKQESWYIGDTYHMAIGQGDLLVTPLQVANFTAVFANGGSLYNPHLIKNILTGDDKSFRQVVSSPIRSNFIDPYNIEVVRSGMRETIVSGSGIRLSTLPVKVAGKTGTAQWSSEKAPHAWFVGFAPYDDPDLAFAFLIEEGEEGSKVTVSIAYDFLNWYFEERLDAETE